LCQESRRSLILETPIAESSTMVAEGTTAMVTDQRKGGSLTSTAYSRKQIPEIVGLIC